MNAVRQIIISIMNATQQLWERKMGPVRSGVYLADGTVKMSKVKSQILQQLVSTLNRLVEILRLDSSCPWIAKFEHDLARGRELLASQHQDDELRSFSSSIRHVFQGMGSFNDYTPAVYNSATGRYTPIVGTEDFQDMAQEVFDLSIKLISKT